MGSMTSRPNLPQVQSPVIYTLPPLETMAPPPAAINQTAAIAATETVAKDEAALAKARETNLLNRSRGAFSTVLTGFRGLLSDGTGAAPRKSLLGE